MSVDLTPMGRADLPLLVGWLREPHVAAWWRDPGDPVERYGPSLDGRDTTRLWLITEDGGPVGMLQTYLFSDEPEWTATLGGITDTDAAAGLDYLIGAVEDTGRGLGSAAIDLAAIRLLAQPDVARVVVDVSVANRASWRALERAGFTRVWTGELDSDDPSDTGPQHVYVRS